MILNDDISILRRRIERERKARQQAEKLLEEKSFDLYRANEELRRLNSSLEVTIQERTEALLRTDLQYRSLIQNLQAGVLLEDEQRRIVLTNKIFCDLFGIPAPPEVLVGVDCSQSAEQSKQLFANPEEFVKRIAELLANRKLSIGEELVMANGRILERDYIPIFADKRYVGHLWRYEDITEQRRTQGLLRQSEEKYRGILENMNLGLIEVDNEDVIQKVYSRFSQLVGYTAEELVGRKAGELLLPDSAFRSVLEEQNKMRLAGEPSVYEVPIRRKDGQVIWVIISGAPIFDSDGKVVGSVGIHLDISERKRVQEALEEARNIAEDARKAEKRFLANMSHEIRTPINGIIGMMHLLKDTPLTPVQTEYLDAISHSADLLLALVSDVLDISKIEAGEMKPTERPFDLPDLLNDLTKSFRLRLRDKPVKVECFVDSNIQRSVIGDPTFLRQILMNLLGNSGKFTERGYIRIQITLLDKLGDFLMTEVSVSDTGIGIAPEHLETIFESFKQADSDVKIKYGGTGLGLAIARQLVNLHGGEISVDSTLGKGTTFTFTLPLKAASVLSKESDPLPETLTLSLRNRRILIVEDNPLNQKYVQGLMRKWEANFAIANDGQEAIELLQDQVYDLILMDLMMPRLNGFDTTVQIRSLTGNNNKAIPIIALTATAFAEEQAKARKCGMNDYLAKPFTPDQLLRILKRYFPDEPVTMPDNMPTQQTSSFADEPFRFNSLLDTNQLELLYGQDYEYAYIMFDLFDTTTKPELIQVQVAIDTQNWEMLGRLLHQFRPSLSMVGLTDLAELSKQIEQLIREGASVHLLTPLLLDFRRIAQQKLPLVEQECNRLAKLSGF